MSDFLVNLEPISSAANPLVKLARQVVTRRRARHREGLYLIEGERAIRTACEHGSAIHTFIVDAERLEHVSEALAAFIQQSPARQVALDTHLFRSISDAEHPPPFLAIARIPEHHFPPSPTSIVALDAVRDPGNLGTIVRTAAAAGVDGVALLPGCVDPFHPAAVRASAGTIAVLPVLHFAQISDILTTHMSNYADVNVVAADAEGTLDYRDFDWAQPQVMVAGNESHGLSEAVQNETTVTVRIPMATGIESLNVSIATGVLLFHMRSVREGR